VGCRETAVSESGLDVPNAARRGRVHETDGRFEHFCTECGRVAPFGYGVRLHTGQLGKMTSARIDSTAAITDFLNRVLAGGALAVAELEAKARAAGLLGERQQIQHAKAFKKAKKSLGMAEDGTS